MLVCIHLFECWQFCANLFYVYMLIHCAFKFFFHLCLCCVHLTVAVIYFFLCRMKSRDDEYLAWNECSKPKRKEKKKQRQKRKRERGKKIRLSKKTNGILNGAKANETKLKKERKFDKRTHFRTEHEHRTTQTPLFTHCYRTPFIC